MQQFTRFLPSLVCTLFLSRLQMLSANGFVSNFRYANEVNGFSRSTDSKCTVGHLTPRKSSRGDNSVLRYI
jgi:hypothetical protein